MKIKEELYTQLQKLKKQKKSIKTFLINKGYSQSYVDKINKNWSTLEILNGKNLTENITEISEVNNDKLVTLNIDTKPKEAAMVTSLVIRARKHKPFIITTLANVKNKLKTAVESSNVTSLQGFEINLVNK